MSLPILPVFHTILFIFFIFYSVFLAVDTVYKNIAVRTDAREIKSLVDGLMASAVVIILFHFALYTSDASYLPPLFPIPDGVLMGRWGFQWTIHVFLLDLGIFSTIYSIMRNKYELNRWSVLLAYWNLGVILYLMYFIVKRIILNM